MSFDEGTEHGERRTSRTIGGCGKHPGQSMINCPLCATEKATDKKREPKSIQDLAIENNWSGDEVLMASNFLIALRLTKAKIPPEELMKVVNNWERIKKAIRILNYDFDI